MADIALVFHWGPETMDRMELEELADWRERARIRHETKPRSSS
jgi:hypothetical protein